MLSMKFTALIILGSLSIIGCSSLHQVGKRDHTADQSDVPSNDSSWSVAPLQTEDMQFLDVNPPALWGGRTQSGVEPYIFSTNESISQPANVHVGRIKKMTGYRVQLFAGHEQDRAIDIKAAAESRFNISVYMVYEAPQYKVRAGNFVNRMEAGELLSQIKTDGFRDAWIVRSQVEIEQ